LAGNQKLPPPIHHSTYSSLFRDCQQEGEKKISVQEKKRVKILSSFSKCKGKPSYFMGRNQ
jgi:hypothetical protein